jgi:glyceraldehyde-3-phosphate dehydrogenase (NADP+)
MKALMQKIYYCYQDYIRDTIDYALQMEKDSSKFETTDGVAAQVKRLPVGYVAI